MGKLTQAWKWVKSLFGNKQTEHTIEYRDGIKWIEPKHGGNVGTFIWLSCPNCQHTNKYKIVGKKYQATGISRPPDACQLS